MQNWENPIIQKIRDGMDELFLWSENKLKPATKELFTNLGIEGFAEIYLSSKKYWFAVSNKILADLVKLSFAVYSNVDILPLKRKTILPAKNGSYKFIISSLPHPLLRWKTNPGLVEAEDDTNTLLMVSTDDPMHADIASKLWLDGDIWQVNIFWWARVDVDHENKTLNIRDDSGSYWSCSNQMVEWMLEDYRKKWYTITINMTQQNEFFTQE